MWTGTDVWQWTKLTKLTLKPNDVCQSRGLSSDLTGYLKVSYTNKQKTSSPSMF